MAIGTTTALVASLAVSAISSGMSYMQSKAQVDAQEAYNDQLVESAIESYQQLDKQEADAIEQSHKQSLQAQREYLQARSSTELQAAATGTYGQSLDIAINDLNTGLGQRMSDITQQRERHLDNIDTQALNIQGSVSKQADYTVTPPAYYQAAMTGLSSFQRTYGTISDVNKTSKEAAKAN